MHWKTLIIGVVVLSCLGTARGQTPTPEEAEVLRLYRQMTQHIEHEQFTDAAQLGEQSLPQAKQIFGPEHFITARFLLALSTTYQRLGSHQTALEHALEGLAIISKIYGDNHLETAAALSVVSPAYQRLGQYEAGLKTAQQALAIYKRILKGAKDAELYIALAHHVVSMAHQHLGQYEQALEQAQQALAISRAAPDRSSLWLHNEALFLNKISALYQRLGQYELALEHIQQALAIHRTAPDRSPLQTAATLDIASRIHRELGQYAQALEPAQKALTIRREHPDTNPADLAMSLHQVSRIYQHLGHHAQALRYAQQALAIRTTIPPGEQHRSVVTILGDLGILSWGLGQHEQALQHFTHALQIQREIFTGPHPETEAFLRSIAMIAHALDQYDQALTFYSQALAAEDSIFANIFALPSEIQKQRFTDRFLRGTGMFALSLIRHHRATDEKAQRLGLTWLLRRKGLVLDTQSRHQATFLANLHGEALTIWERIRRNRSIYALLSLSPPDDNAPIDSYMRLAEIAEAIARDEEQLAQQSPGFRGVRVQAQVTPEQVAQRLPADSVLIEFGQLPDLHFDAKRRPVRGNDHYVAFVLTPDNQVTLKDLGATETVDANVDKAHARIANALDYLKDLRGQNPDLYPSPTARLDTALADLYGQLIEPLEPIIKPYRRLIVSPDGKLSGIPFAALRQPDGTYLIETRSLSYVTSGRDLLREAEEVPAGLNLLLVANPTLGEYRSPQSSAGTAATPAVQSVLQRADIFPFKQESISGTALEAEKIPPLVAGNPNQKRVLTQANATERDVRQTVSPRILHLATHGFFLEDIPLPQEKLPMIPPLSSSESAALLPNLLVRSGLALAGANEIQKNKADEDGILTALEVTGMNLQATQLVVLSACDTGTGIVRISEGVYGLRRAFVLAGANALVISLWRADDGLTVSHMETFYRQLSHGLTVTEALRDAQRHSIHELRQYFSAQIEEALAPVWLWAPFLAQQTGTDVRLVQQAP